MKSFQHSILLATISTTCLATSLRSRQQLDCSARPLTCVSGVLVVAARGTGDNQDANTPDPAYADIGNLTTIASSVITAAGKDSYCQAVRYPAARPDYFTSVGHGIDAVQGIVQKYVDQCKDTVTPRIVLLGYSQGAQVVAGALAGTTGKERLGTSYGQFITAGTLFASPSWIPGYEPLDAGNATTSGLFAKTTEEQKYLSDTYGARIRDFCEAGDRFCANAGDADVNSVIHLRSVPIYTDEAVEFLTKKV